jgi:biopolymer transport protein ExbD
LNLKPDHRDEIDLNLTPLIDVVFLLLIFFMVSTTFDQQSKLKVELPEASSQAVKQEPNTIIIGIDAKGRFFINDRQLVNTQFKTLKMALIKTVGKDKDVPLVLKADAQTPHQAVVMAMDAAAQLGLTRLSIATLEKHSK